MKENKRGLIEFKEVPDAGCFALIRQPEGIIWRYRCLDKKTYNLETRDYPHNKFKDMYSFIHYIMDSTENIHISVPEIESPEYSKQKKKIIDKEKLMLKAEKYKDFW